MQDLETLWRIIRGEAAERAAAEPVLASFYHANILNHDGLDDALSYHMASQLGCDSVPAMLLREVADLAYRSDASIVQAAAADIWATFDRDAACDAYLLPLMHFKGFQAIQAWRVSHWLWHNQRQSMALFLQNRIATTFDVDIHPAATLGEGIMVDHATGVVIGETAVVGNNVSLLHSVTLGGCGNARGDRHPKVGDGVLIAAGAKVLGNIEIGEGAKIAAGSVVLEAVPPHTTVAGVPAVVVGRPKNPSPALEMDQNLDAES